MIIVYTGNGKGKTSACLGQVVRALGRGMKVAFAQFMKKDGEAGEQVFLKNCLGTDFFAGGIGFFLDESTRPQHRQAALNTLAWSYEALEAADILILDESLYALGNGLITMNELQGLLEYSKQTSCHLILSGRGFPDQLSAQVDLITEMREIKHPWQQGMAAQSGLDY